MTTTMNAWVQHEYGGPEAVSLRHISVPEPGPGEVLLKVRATSLNAADVRIMRGDPTLLRLGFGLRRPKRVTRGMDVAGTVVALGEGADAGLLGAEVVGELPGGGLAEYVTAAAKRLTTRPHSVDPAAAATVPLAGGTAWQALRAGGITRGQRVLVIGASGGVGTFTVQLAADEGAEVWALCGARNQELVEGLGASRTFDYRTTALRDLPEEEFDLVVAIAGIAPFGELRRLLRPGGTAQLVGGKGGPVLGPIPRTLGAALSSIGSKKPVRPLFAMADPAITTELLERVAAGRITPVIERTWDLTEAGAALAHVDSGRTVGKVVVTVDCPTATTGVGRGEG